METERVELRAHFARKTSASAGAAAAALRKAIMGGEKSERRRRRRRWQQRDSTSQGIPTPLHVHDRCGPLVCSNESFVIGGLLSGFPYLDTCMMMPPR